MEPKNIILTKHIRPFSPGRNEPANRSGEAFGGLESKRLGENYLTPSGEEVEKTADRLLYKKDIAAVIPMKERGAVIRPLLEQITKQLASERITVINDNSDEAAVETVKQFREVRLADRDAVLEALDWKRLLEILHVKEIPRGKGMAVLAGHLLHYALAKKKRVNLTWLFQHDAEVSQYARHRGLDYLIWGLLNSPANAHHIKTAKYGRGNERCMAARSLLLSLRHLPIAAGKNTREIFKIEKRGFELFARLAPLKWMLSGQFAISWDAALRRPFATGYLEETLMATFLEDRGNKLKKITVQVANPNPCLDGANDSRKEDIMQQMISNFLFVLAFVKKPVSDWTIENIAYINRDFMRRPVEFARIPSDEGAVIWESVENERILPSIKMLEQEGMIHFGKLDKLIKE